MIQLTVLLLITAPLAIILPSVAASMEKDDAPMFDDTAMSYLNATAFGRDRRSIMCPPQCYGSCQTTSQCQQYSPSMVCIQACCCPISVDLSTACDGDPAVAACINGLCGQGWFCNARNFCCRCQSGRSPGQCVNNLCPTGYACNTNGYCCPLGSGSVLGPCVNGRCPAGYTCGAGDLCYPNLGAI